RESQSPPLILADPLYGEPANANGFLAHVEYPRRPARAQRKFRESVTAGTDLSSVYFAPLSGSAHEAREIKALFPQADVLLGARATEAVLKNAAAPRILHIATHGFLLNDPSLEAKDIRSSHSIRDAARPPGNITIDQPLLHSGLALAGANARVGEEDGILT